MLVLDTHVYVWLVQDSHRLSVRARRRIEREMARGQVHVSAITFWELGMLMDEGRLRMSRELSEVRSIAQRSGAREIPVDGEIALVAARIAGLPGDPGDRIIVATALCRHATLMTADERLLALRGGPVCVDASL